MIYYPLKQNQTDWIKYILKNGKNGKCWQDLATLLATQYHDMYESSMIYPCMTVKKQNAGRKKIIHDLAKFAELWKLENWTASYNQIYH